MSVTTNSQDRMRETYVEDNSYEIVEDPGKIIKRDKKFPPQKSKTFGKRTSPRIIYSKRGLLIVISGTFILLLGLGAIAAGIYFSRKESKTDILQWNKSAYADFAKACDFDRDAFDAFQIEESQCGRHCKETQGCTHFAWTDSKGGTCWMKNGPVSKSDAKYNHNFGMICGIAFCDTEIVWEESVKEIWSYACDFDKKHFEVGNTEKNECAKMCENTKGCTHFAWTDNNGGTCWMKNGPVSKSKSDAKFNGNFGMICGIVKS